MDTSDPDSALKAGFELEAAGWKAKAGTAIQCQPEVSAFYSLLARRAAEQGWLRLHFLTVSGRRIAFDYSLCYKNRLYVLKLGWDPSYATYSPYKLLFNMVLQRAFEQRLTEYDFLGAAQPWKLEWTTTTKPHSWLYVFPATSKGQSLHFVKFQLLPALQRQKAYVALRDRLLSVMNHA